ncbi:MAG: TorF family putative porin [Hyphomicrobium sp.]
MMKFMKLASAAALAGIALAGPARADDPPKLAWSMTAAGTSDYMFRGFSQTREDPAFQLSFDATYGIFYAGVWGSNIDFDEANAFKENVEIDFYAGITPALGSVTFDLGVLYYYYPGVNDFALGGEADYVELKAGAKTTLMEKLALAAYVYWTPDNFGETGSVVTIEGSANYTLGTFGIFTPTIGGTIGTALAENNIFGGGDNYLYWNAGLALAVDKFTFDFRYWDTDLNDATCKGEAFQCDERFVFTTKITLP